MSNNETIPVYGSKRCVKCGTREASVCWIAAETVTDIYEKRPPEAGPLLSGLVESDPETDLMERECVTCGYSWWELPLDNPGVRSFEEDPRDAENRALRRLIVAIDQQANLGTLQPSTRAGLSAVLQAEDDQAEEDIAAAAPFFAPLRREE